jgi:hypothetical protein
MYGDNYKPESPKHWERLEKLFEAAQSRKELSGALMLALLDMDAPRQDLHVLHKRTCLKKGWEEVS